LASGAGWFALSLAAFLLSFANADELIAMMAARANANFFI
jgi:hypothetical protein